MKYRNLINIIEEIAQPHLAEEWDNSGVQINVGHDEIHKILICLEINREVIEEAKSTYTDIIISHHPLLFTATKCVDADDGQIGEYITELIQNNISVYSAHLSFDNAPLGNNYYMAKLLKMTNIIKPDENIENIPGLVGDLPNEMLLSDACKYVERALDLPENYIRVSGNLNETVRKVALCTGAGGEFMEIAMENGCDLFITGDIKFHQAQRACAKGLLLIDAGHYGTEKIFVENFASQLRARADSELIIQESSANTNPFVL